MTDKAMKRKNDQASLFLRRPKWINSIMAFVAPICVLLFVYALAGIMPFGDKSVMTGDCTIQYSAFLAYMREILKGNVSAFYTYAKALGGDLSGFLSYYVLSPFNLIMPLFQNAQIQEAVLALILLKTGAAGYTMYFYLNAKTEQGLKAVLFATAYALMGYNLVYQNNIMWLDGLVFLPFIVRGIEKVILAGKSFARQNLMYLISLSVLLLTNYYIGYMVCIFAVLYAAYYLFFDRETFYLTKSEKWAAIKAFAATSALAGALAAVTLLPTALSLRGGKAAFDIRELLDFTVLYSPLQVFKELFAGQYAVALNLNALPKIYCGVLILVLAAVYLMSKKVPRREKIGTVLLLSCLYASFLISAFDRVWHGTTVPAGAPHRYSFVFSFVLVAAAYKGFAALRLSCAREMVNICVLCGAIFALYLVARKTIDAAAICNAVWMTLYLALLFYARADYVSNKPKKYSGGALVLMGVVFLTELIYSGRGTLQAIGYTDKAEFNQKVERAEENVQWIKNQDTGWYRMEQYGTNVTMNDAMLFQYHGLWSYSSCEKEATKRLAGKLGLNDRSWWITYHNEVPAASESFLGLKYIVTNRSVLHDNTIPIRENTETGVQIYQNTNALPVGFLVNEETAKTNFDTWDVPAIQNDLWKRMTGGAEDIYAYADREETICEEHLIEYQLEVQEELPIYTCFRNWGTIDEMKVAVNGSEVRNLIPEMQSYCLGTFRKGDVLTITISNESQDMSWYDLYFYYEKEELLRQYSGLLQKQGLQLSQYGQDRMQGTVDNRTDEKKLLLLTIPADSGWKILVDGAAQPIQSIAGGFMSVEIEPGVHEIECQFIPPGLWQGVAVSLTALCIIVMIGSKKIFMADAAKK